MVSVAFRDHDFWIARRKYCGQAENGVFLAISKPFFSVPITRPSSEYFAAPIHLWIETRPDTRQSSRGQLGRSSNAKTARNSEMLWWDRRIDRVTGQGVESCVLD